MTTEYKGHTIHVQELRKGERDWSEDACIYSVPSLLIKDECEEHEALYYAKKEIDAKLGIFDITITECTNKKIVDFNKERGDDAFTVTFNSNEAKKLIKKTFPNEDRNVLNLVDIENTLRTFKRYSLTIDNKLN